MSEEKEPDDAILVADKIINGKIGTCPVCGARTNMVAWHLELHAKEEPK